MRRYKVQHICVGVIMVFLLFAGGCKAKFVFSDHLEEDAILVESNVISLQELSYYIMIVEEQVNEMAYNYDESDLNEFWNMYTNGMFVRVWAKDMAVENAVRVEIFNIEAENLGLRLSDEEEEKVYTSAMEAYDNMNGHQKEVTGLSLEWMENIIKKILISESYVSYMAEQGVDAKALAVEGNNYKEMRQQYNVVINEKIMDKFELGDITIRIIEE